VRENATAPRIRSFTVNLFDLIGTVVFGAALILGLVSGAADGANLVFITAMFAWCAFDLTASLVACDWRHRKTASGIAGLAVGVVSLSAFLPRAMNTTGWLLAESLFFALIGLLFVVVTVRDLAKRWGAHRASARQAARDRT